MSSRKGQMKEAALLALSEGIEIDQIQITEAGLVVSVIATHPQSVVRSVYSLRLTSIATTIEP